MGFLDGKNAVVTGGNRGIGRGVAAALSAEGAKVLLTSRSQSQADAAAREIGHGAIGAECDVRSYDSVQKLFATADAKLDGLDILVNNAGVGVFGPAPEMAIDDWHAVIETNLNGVFYCCREGVPRMKKRGGGYIFNISSLAGRNAFAGAAAYNASKFGLNGFSEALMMDVRYDGIRVSYLMPGSVATDFGGGSRNKEGWALTANDVGDVVLDLLRSPARALYSRVEMRPAQPPRK